MRTNTLQRLSAALFRPVDIAFLVYFRIAFGAIMLWEVYRFFTHGWISRYYIEPLVHFTYYGFSWVKPWPGRGMYVHFFVLGVAAFCIIIGFCYRIAAAVFFVGFSYVFLLEQARYLNHFYLVCLIGFLLIFLPANRAVSVDALLRPKIRSDTVPAWTLWLLRAQIGVAYFFGGIAKLNSDWLFGGEPMRIWLSPFTKLPLFGPIVQNEWVVYSFVYGGLLLDLFIVPLLLWRKTRPFAFVAAIAFNLLNAIIFSIGIFPWFMLAASLVFFPPDLLRRFVRAIKSTGHASLDDAPETEELAPAVTEVDLPLTTAQRRTVFLLAAYLAIQIVMPLRHYAYPGNVSWTEEGHNFSWHMKLRTKGGNSIFSVVHPQSGQSWTIDPAQYLPPWQLIKMSTKPDLIVQFAHHLAEEKRRQGYDNVEVRAKVMASLNGRRQQLMIDPDVDLTKVGVSLLPARWILPLTTSLETRGTAAEQDDEPEN
ncbi:MAG TPA: HTTM domain-containing protein [Pyrinomonadaceae bacterium]|nr:HTTM domain-containing protein [Pyrinomonadaceae bacterium]